MNQPALAFTDDSKAFLQATLEKEALRSERNRLALLLGFLALAFASFVVLTFLPGFLADTTRQSFRTQAPQVVALFCSAITYEAVLFAVVGKLLREGRQPSHWARYVNVFIETSLPTITVLIASTVFGPVQALAAAPTRFYFLFITMAALQLDSRLCLFSGAVAAIQYSASAFLLLGQVDRGAYPPLLTDFGHQLALAGLLLMAGVVAGFVASQIRRQVVAALQSTEDRNRTIGLFGQYVSPEVVEKVLRHPVGLSGEMRGVSVMFLDIRNFSGYALNRSPEEVMAYLNILFGTMVDVVNRHHGIVNKFLGDGFMAIFGAPTDDSEHCANAVNAGFEILAAVQKLNERGAIEPTRVGIGVHVGEVVTGNVGSTKRKEYTIIGDVVNLASRIESACKQFNAQMLVSADVRQRLDASIPSDDVGLVELKGQKVALRLHRLA